MIFTLNGIEKELEAEKEASSEISASINRPRKYGIYNTKGELIINVTTRNEAVATKAEWRRMDFEETGQRGNYIIKKLVFTS